MTTLGISHRLSFFTIPPFYPKPQSISFQGHQFSNISVFSPTVSLIANGSRRKPTASSSKAVCRSKPNDELAFLDENGVVEDMDAYLNHLSLEYDSVWDTKPSWCQPWTIALTGILAITGSWLILHSVIATALALALVSAWWYIFLYSYPKAYAQMIAERREKVTNGLEDTYGEEKNQ